MVEKKGEDDGYKEFTATMSVVIPGRRTFDWVAGEFSTSHYDSGEREVYAITKKEKKKEIIIPERSPD